MDRVIEVKVNGTFVSKDSPSAGSQGEANATALRIEFDEGWDGFAKTITWWDAKGENPTSRVLTADLLEDIVASSRIYLTMIPSEALTVWGKCIFSVDGYTNGKRNRSAYSQLVVKPNGDGNDVAIESVTPSQAEQLQVQIDTLLGDMQEQAIIAHNAATAAKASEEAAAQSAAEAAQSAAESMQSSVEAATEARNAYTYSKYAEESKEAAKIFADRSEASGLVAREAATAAENSASQSAQSAVTATTKAQEAASSEKKASASAAAAALSEEASALNRAYAFSHEESAALHDRNAQSYATDARASREAAQAAEASAKAAQAAAEKARNEASSIVGGNFATEEYVNNAVASAEGDIDGGTF